MKSNIAQYIILNLKESKQGQAPNLNNNKYNIKFEDNDGVP